MFELYGVNLLCGFDFGRATRRIGAKKSTNNTRTHCGTSVLGPVPSYKLRTKQVAISARPISTMEATKNFPMSGVTSDVVGVFSAIISMNTVMARRVVITRVTLSPVFGGNTKVNRAKAVMRKQGTIRLLK